MPPPFRPYGGDEFRVVSDVSRFDFQNNANTRLRSRNTTPTNTDIVDMQSSSKMTLDTIIPFYSSRVVDVDDDIDGRSRYKPLPNNDLEEDVHDIFLEEREGEDINPKQTINLPKQRRPARLISRGVQVPQDHIARGPTPPPKDASTSRHLQSERGFLPYPASVTDIPIPIPVPDPNPNTNSALQQSDQLPAMPQPSEKLNNQRKVGKKTVQFEEDPDNVSVLSRRKQLEHDLVKNVMSRPLISFKADRFGEEYYGKTINITTNFILYLFEIFCSIIEIVLASVLLQYDNDVSVGIYRYFIADGSISLAIAVLFTLQFINYEKRNGSFYCLVATIMKLVSFILIIAYIFPLARYATQKIWLVRRANGAFIIISTFLWITNLTMFLTTLYISRLNLLEELNFDYDRRGLDDNFNKRRRSGGGFYGDRHESEPLKEYYLNENGEMYALNEEWEKEELKQKGKNKILVYTF